MVQIIFTEEELEIVFNGEFEEEEEEEEETEEMEVF